MLTFDCVHFQAGGIGNDALRISAVFGNLHSSAAIDSAGRLYTWGSTANYRLMHDLPLRAPERDKKLVEYAVLARKKLNMGALGAVTQEKAAEAAAEADAVAQSVLKPVTSLRFPTLVCSPHFDGSRISSFAFSKMSSAALIMTAIEKVSPLNPYQSFSFLFVKIASLIVLHSLCVRATVMPYCRCIPWKARGERSANSKSLATGSGTRHRSS